MPIELIALDLDDTLLRADLTISPRNRETLRKASARGIRVVLASGRNIHSMRRYAGEIDAAGEGEYMICTNGAEIMETWTGKRVYERGIDGSLCLEIADTLESHGFPWQVYEEGKIRATRSTTWTELDTKLTGQPLEIISPEARRPLLERGQIKFVVPAEPERVAVFMPQLKAMLEGRAEVLVSKPFFLEILPLGVDKGDALHRLCRRLGVGIERTMACGDAMNDLGMLREAGHSCCPANAVPEAKALARHVSSLTNEEDFVADVVERFALS